MLFRRKAKKVTNCTLEQRITGGQAKYVRMVRFDHANGTLTLEILRDYYHPDDIETLVVFHSVENFTWHDQYPDDAPVDWENEVVVEDLIGITEKVMPVGTEFCVRTEYREFSFTTKAMPEIISK